MIEYLALCAKDERDAAIQENLIDAADLGGAAWSADGRFLVTAGDDRLIRIWDVAKHRLARRLVGHEAAVFAVAVRPDSTLLASGDTEGEVYLWSVLSAERLATLSCTPDSNVVRRPSVFSLDFHPEGRVLLIGGSKDLLVAWDLEHYDRHIAGSFAYRESLRSRPEAGTEQDASSDLQPVAR